MNKLTNFTVGLIVVILFGCGKTKEQIPLQSPSPEPIAVPTVTPAPTPVVTKPSPVTPIGETPVSFVLSDMGNGKRLEGTVNHDGEILITNYPKAFNVELVPIEKRWTNPFEEDPDKFRTPYSAYTCEKLKTFAKVAGSESTFITNSMKENALFWLRRSSEVLVTANLPHLPGLGEDLLFKIKKKLEEDGHVFEKLTFLNPLSPSSIRLVEITETKANALTIKAGNLDEIKRKMPLLFSNISPSATPFIQEPIALRDVLCDLSTESLSLRFQISTTNQDVPQTIDFTLQVKKVGF